MAIWTDIPDVNLEPDKPILSTDVIALRENPKAIAEGAADAPRIQTAAIQDGAVTTAKTATNERMTTANVLGATAGGAAGAVGTYAWLLHATANTAITAGSTYAGSSLRYAGIQYRVSDSTVVWAVTPGGTPAGTWRAVGTQTSRDPYYSGTMFLRIS